MNGRSEDILEAGGGGGGWNEVMNGVVCRDLWTDEGYRAENESGRDWAG